MNYKINYKHLLTNAQKRYFIERFGQDSPQENLLYSSGIEVPTSVKKKLILHGREHNLKLQTISIFTGKPQTDSEPHIDTYPGGLRLPWRLNYYIQGKGILNWWEEGNTLEEHTFHSNKERTTIIDSLDTSTIESAFIRTDIPHNIDMRESKETRITLTATYEGPAWSPIPPSICCL